MKELTLRKVIKTGKFQNLCKYPPFYASGATVQINNF